MVGGGSGRWVLLGGCWCAVWDAGTARLAVFWVALLLCAAPGERTEGVCWPKATPTLPWRVSGEGYTAAGTGWGSGARGWVGETEGGCCIQCFPPVAVVTVPGCPSGWAGALPHQPCTRAASCWTRCAKSFSLSTEYSDSLPASACICLFHEANVRPGLTL